MPACATRVDVYRRADTCPYPTGTSPPSSSPASRPRSARPARSLDTNLRNGLERRRLRYRAFPTDQYGRTGNSRSTIFDYPGPPPVPAPRILALAPNPKPNPI